MLLWLWYGRITLTHPCPDLETGLVVQLGKQLTHLFFLHCFCRNLPISEKNELVKVKLSEIDRNEKCGNEENYLVEHVSNLNIEGRALKKSEEIRLSTMSQTSDQQPINNLTQNTVCPKLFDKTPQPSREKLVSSLAGPSPTLTTKQAFAEVMPWFNTTVGLDNSDAQFEANFKNDPNAESNVGLFEVLTGKLSSKVNEKFTSK